MDISSETRDEITIVRFEGSLDTNTSTDAQDYLNRAIEGRAGKLVVSFEKVDFVSSAGLRVLLATAKKLGSDNFRVCGLNESVAEIFEISGFNTILSVFGSEAEATAGF